MSWIGDHQFLLDPPPRTDQASLEQETVDEERLKSDALVRDKADLTDELQQRLVSSRAILLQ